MIKVAMMGAGSAVFCRGLVRDALSFESLEDAHFALMDVSEERLGWAYNILQSMKEQNSLKCTFSATIDRREALTDADFAISMIQVGGLEPYELDLNIPMRYGVDQCIGDTLSPGGIFRGLRHVPALLEMMETMTEVSPDVVFMNYANPMAICSWGMQKSYPDITSVGLCHGVQHTTMMICDWMGVPVEECAVQSVGINHMAWFTTFKHNGQDLYPAIWEKLEKEGPKEGENYRFEMMKAAGYFMTESSGHLSEYLPYFRKRQDVMDLLGSSGFGGETATYLNHCLRSADGYKKGMEELASGAKPIPYDPAQGPSLEYAANIMNAKRTDNPFRFAGNVLNKGFIPNLPYDSCVEVPTYADRLGLHGSYVGRMPEQCAALCQSNISAQELTVKAAIEGDYEAAYHACLMDPLTAAVLAPHEIRNMVEEMLEAQAEWLPQFKGKTKSAPGWNIGRRDNGQTGVKSGAAVDAQIGHYDKD